MSFVTKLNEIKDYIALKGRSGIAWSDVIERHSIGHTTRVTVLKHLYRCAFQFTCLGSEVDVEGSTSINPSDLLIVAPPHHRLAALGITSKTQLPQDNAFEVLELIGQSGENGIFLTDTASILEVRYIHPIIDTLSEKRLITKYMVMRSVLNTNRDSGKRENLLRLQRFDAWIPKLLQDSPSEHEHPLISTLCTLTKDYSVTCVPDKTMATLLGIPLSCLQKHLPALLQSSVLPFPIVFHSHATTNEPMLTVQPPEESSSSDSVILDMPLFANALYLIQNAGTQGMSTTDLRLAFGMSQKTVNAVVVPVLTRTLKLPVKDVQVGRQRTPYIYGSNSLRDGIEENTDIVTIAPQPSTSFVPSTLSVHADSDDNEKEIDWKDSRTLGIDSSIVVRNDGF